MSRKLKSLCAAFAFAAAVGLAGCVQQSTDNANTTATTNATPPAVSSPATQNIAIVERPQAIKDKMSQRGEQDEAKPILRVVSPRDNSTITGSTVPVMLNLSGELKGYKPMKDPATGMGNHIHVILDNQPYEAYYDIGQPFELRNVTEGKHTLRVFASRPWHESYKNEGNFQMVTFTVKGGGDASKPTTTGAGQTMADNENANANSNAKSNSNSNANASASPALTREGKDMAESHASDVDPKKPLLTYSRPKGEYKNADADAVMIDFWLSNAKLQADGGDYRVRYSIDNGEAKTLDNWTPIWLSGWTAGKHTVKLELIDKDGNVVANGDYNSTTREITITK
ncbi:MAG: hypothetical protein ABR577_18905 [Pyrinomonadaceae bacterium]